MANNKNNNNNNVRKPIDFLRKEHKFIREIIKILEASARNMEESGKIDREILNGAINLINNFTHKYHRRKEEGVLFKMAENKREMAWVGGGIIPYFREHEEGAEYVRALARELEETVKKGVADKKSRKLIVKNIYGYAALLSSHMLQEEKTLYPRIEAVLNKQEQENILKSYKELYNEMIAVGDKERFENMVKEYKKKLGI